MAQEAATAPQTDVEQRESDYDIWFREQVEIGMREADDPNTVWFTQEEVMHELDELRKTWRSEAAKERNVA
jgi:hypothetical protein